MKHGISEIDHVVSVVPNAQRAGALLERVGFTLTPLSVMETVGVANRLVLFKPLSSGTANFIELMSVLDERRLPAPLRPHVAGVSGYRWLVLSGPDASAAFEQLNAGGYSFGRPIPIERDWALPSGEVLRLAFNVLLPIDAPIPFNFCEYKTLEHYLRAEFLGHPNGAESLTALLCQASTPEECLRYFESLWGVTRKSAAHGLSTVTPGKVELMVGARASWESALNRAVAPDSSGQRMFGARIRVGNLAATRRYFAELNLTVTQSELGLVLDSPLADGTCLVFHD
jgi:hypothetical protein